jgi:ATP-dependent Lon protease
MIQNKIITRTKSTKETTTKTLKKNNNEKKSIEPIKYVITQNKKKNITDKKKKTIVNINNFESDTSITSDYESESDSDYESESESESESVDVNLNVDKINKKEDNDTVSADDEKIFMNENYIIFNEPNLRESKKKKDDNKPKNCENEYCELLEIKKNLLKQLTKKKNSKILLNAIKECNETIKLLISNTRYKNMKVYNKLLNQEPIDEMNYFKTKISNKEQLIFMEELIKVNNFITIDKPYRLSLLETKIPYKYKAVALQKINTLEIMEPYDHEYFQMKQWVENFMKIPFGIYKSLSVNLLKDGKDVCKKYLDNASQILEDCVYGMKDTKLQILQFIGQWITNPDAIGNAIALKGAFGVGKTTIVKNGISKILGREFSFISLGGTGDGSFLEGFSSTYVSSKHGKIVQILIDSQCMNPIIYFDELDKLSESSRSNDIAGIITHLIDTTQNSNFHDKYFSEVDFDLSKCLFIFSYNDESLVPPVLLDRMYKINVEGYSTKDKLIIANKYIIPFIRDQIMFEDKDVIIPDNTMIYIINIFTKKEEGVRNLKRCLEIIFTKLNLLRISDNIIDIKIEFPIVLLPNHIDLLIKNDSQNNTYLNFYS